MYTENAQWIRSKHGNKYIREGKNLKRML